MTTPDGDKTSSIDSQPTLIPMSFAIDPESLQPDLIMDGQRIDPKAIVKLDARSMAMVLQRFHAATVATVYADAFRAGRVSAATGPEG
jgi:hypothetical protein